MVSHAGRIAIGIDVGTSAVKAVAITESGSTVSRTSAPYATATPFEGAAVQDPDAWWEAALASTRELVEALVAAGESPGPETTTISLTGQMHTSVFLDESGEPVHPAVLWSDKRSTLECRTIEEREPAFAEITGNPAMPAFTVAHTLWLRDNRRHLFDRVRVILNPKDEIRRRLGAGVATEYSDASGTGFMDTRSGHWADAVLERLTLSHDLLPRIVSSHAVTGQVGAFDRFPDDDPLRRLTGTPVIGGGGDQATQAVALGVTEPGRLGLSLGTSGVAFSASAEPRLGAFRHSYDDLWLTLDSTHAAGLVLQWFSEVTRTSLPDLAPDPAAFDDLPIFLPYLQGHRDGGGGAPGSFIGLDARHSRDDLAYSVMEGVAFELRRLADGVDGTGASTVHIGGGGARSQSWRQIIANTFGREVRYADRGSAYGAAVLAAEAAGWWPDAAGLEHDEELTAPDPAAMHAASERNRAFTTYSRLLAGVS